MFIKRLNCYKTYGTEKEEILVSNQHITVN